MKYLMIALAFACACDDGDADTAEVKALKAECHEVLKHVVAVSPQAVGRDAETITTALPAEDIGACMASEPELRTCMVSAPDLAAVKKCIPSVAILDCMQTAAKAKKAAHEKARQEAPDPATDKSFDDIRARCWAGDAKAAASLKLD